MHGVEGARYIARSIYFVEVAAIDSDGQQYVLVDQYVIIDPSVTLHIDQSKCHRSSAAICFDQSICHRHRAAIYIDCINMPLNMRLSE